MSNSKTPTSINEHLSALLDDEAGSFEEQRVLDELRNDKSLSEKLSTYALIGETIRSGESEKAVPVLGNSFLDNIREQISSEDTFNDVVLEDQQVPQKTKHTMQKSASTNDASWFQPIGGFAIAASVGALAFMGLLNIGFIGNPNLPSENFTNSSAPTAIAEVAPATKTLEKEISILASTDTLKKSTQATLDVNENDQYIDANARTRSLLKRYVDSHMQYATTSTFVPSARVIAYTDNQ